jgi:hypothetical protein
VRLSSRHDSLASRPRSAQGGVRTSSATFLVLAALVAPLARGDDATPDPGGYFSGTQVERGRSSYRETCGECHKLSEFRGDDFEWDWRRQTAWNLFSAIAETMPEDDPGVLSPEVYVDIVAYLLSVNDYPAGIDDLTPSEDALRAIPLGAGVAKTRKGG